MSSPEKQTTEDMSDGARWLRLFGRPDLLGSQLTLPGGQMMRAEDFPDVCPKTGTDTMRGLEFASTKPELAATAAFELGMSAARAQIDAYFGPPPAEA